MSSWTAKLIRDLTDILSDQIPAQGRDDASVLVKKLEIVMAGLDPAIQPKRDVGAVNGRRLKRAMTASRAVPTPT